MRDKGIWLWVLIIILMLAKDSTGLRINRPPVLKHPLTEEQVSALNKYLNDVFDIENGRYELDISTSSKTNAENGEAWIVFTTPTVKLQFRANSHVYTITPDGF